MVAIERHGTFRLSKRRTLHPGTRFRVKGGPEWRLADGTRVRLAPRGPFTFLACCKRGAVVYIEAADRDGAQAILHISGTRNPIDPALIPKPYTITSVVRKAARARRHHSLRRRRT